MHVEIPLNHHSLLFLFDLWNGLYGIFSITIFETFYDSPFLFSCYCFCLNIGDFDFVLPFQLTLLDIDVLAKQMDKLIRVMQQHFTYNADSYYSQTLFFLSTFMHVLTPRSLHRLIMLDADLQFRADVKHLNELFRQFAPGNVIGIAYEMQPVYRHVLAKYRQAHPETPAGAPKPSGNPGFNSGVLLLNLDEMRLSQQYNSLLSADVVQKLAEKYAFKGHLADQDFYTLISLEHMELFYVLPCTWNRQLCQWWRDKGYEDVFDHYFSCEGDVNIYHGNCNTPFPSP